MTEEIFTNITAWMPADEKPKASGQYIVWTSNGELDIYIWSAKYNGWGLFGDGDKTFEKTDVEYWMAVVPPTIG